jgi:hypothetical protein
MPDFRWVARKVRDFRPSERHTLPIAEFLKLSGIDGEPEWLPLARAWGEQQAPKISFGIGAEGTTVVMRRN